MAKHWNFGTPKRGQPPKRLRDVRIVRYGQRWTASWCVEDGHLQVMSAWGSRSVPAAGDQVALKGRAEVLLEEIVDERSRG